MSQGGSIMSIEIRTDYGQIDISNDVIAQIAGGAAIECYGIVGMASKNQIKDGFAEILRKENFTKKEKISTLICISLSAMGLKFLK